jgi:hypothetical protein
MLTVVLAILLLIAAIGVMYWLLKSMGEDGVEVAAPGSCKSGRCGVRRVSSNGESCLQEGLPLEVADETQLNNKA